MENRYKFINEKYEIIKTFMSPETLIPTEGSIVNLQNKNYKADKVNVEYNYCPMGKSITVYCTETR